MFLQAPRLSRKLPDGESPRGFLHARRGRFGVENVVEGVILV
jgi:hypothetical protein